MPRWNRSRSILVAAATLAGVGLAFPQAAAAFPHRGFHRPRFFVGGFFGFPYHGFGYGPYFGPYLGPYGGIDMNVALLAGVGAIKLNVKPGQAEVWVDGKYWSEARDLDGYPSFLWLGEGVHHLVIYKGGYASFEEDIDVQRGFRKELKVRLEKGDSTPPGRKPGKAT